MVEVVDAIQKFEGLIGALLGVTITLVTTHFLKHGKLIIYPIELKANFSKYEHGYSKETLTIDDAEYASFDLDIEIYNSSDLPKALRQFKIQFYKDDYLLKEVLPKDNSTKRTGQYFTIRDEMNILNLTPKSIERLSFHLDFDSDETVSLKGYNRIVLTFLNHKNKTYKVTAME